MTKQGDGPRSGHVHAWPRLQGTETLPWDAHWVNIVVWSLCQPLGPSPVLLEVLLIWTPDSTQQSPPGGPRSTPRVHRLSCKDTKNSEAAKGVFLPLVDPTLPFYLNLIQTKKGLKQRQGGPWSISPLSSQGPSEPCPDLSSWSPTSLFMPFAGVPISNEFYITSRMKY